MEGLQDFKECQNMCQKIKDKLYVIVRVITHFDLKPPLGIIFCVGVSKSKVTSCVKVPSTVQTRVTHKHWYV